MHTRSPSRSVKKSARQLKTCFNYRASLLPTAYCLLPIKQKSLRSSEGISEATTGFEPVMKVLQTFALPLGHVAINIKR